MLTESIHLYAGFDPREEIGFHTFVSSVIHHSTVPVRITPVDNALMRGLKNGGMRKDETTDFAHARFLIPWIQGFTGWAIFCDGSDMLLRADIAELWEMRNPYKAVQVVKHHYQTKHPVKFVGTDMEAPNIDYPKKNWTSVMLINASSFAWRRLDPRTVAEMPGDVLQQLKFIEDDRIGELPVEWNWLVDEYGANDAAKLIHFTAGIPAFPHYENSPMADEWARAALKAQHVSK